MSPAFTFIIPSISHKSTYLAINALVNVCNFFLIFSRMFNYNPIETIEPEAFVVDASYTKLTRM